MNNPTITAVIPAFNAEKTLLRAVSSVLAQTYQNFELIIVDDGSSDATVQVAQGITDSRVNIISQINQGPGAARNVGLLKAQGRWVAFLDSDDTWEVDFFKDALDALSEFSDSLFYFGASVLDTAKIALKSSRDVHQPYLFKANKKATTKKLRHEVETGLCVMLADKKTLSMLGGYYEKNKCTYGEDSILCFLIFWMYPVVKSPKVVHTYHRATTGLSQSRHINVQVRPLVADSDYVLSRIPDYSHETVRRFIAYNASIDAYRLAKVGRAAEGYQLIIEKDVLSCAYQPSVFRSLVRFVFYSVVSRFRR